MSCELFAVLNLIIDPCIKVHLGHHIEKALYPLIIDTWLFHGQTISSFSYYLAGDKHRSNGFVFLMYE